MSEGALALVQMHLIRPESTRLGQRKKERKCTSKNVGDQLMYKQIYM